MPREFPRFALEATVTIRHAGATTDGRTRNVSRGGLCALVRNPVAVGTEIAVEMKLLFDGGQTSDSLELPGRVVWSTPLDDSHQVGVAFRSLTAEHLKYLELFLRYLTVERRQKPESDADDLFRG